MLLSSLVSDYTPELIGSNLAAKCIDFDAVPRLLAVVYCIINTVLYLSLVFL
jgi:hypothetical protein